MFNVYEYKSQFYSREISANALSSTDYNSGWSEIAVVPFTWAVTYTRFTNPSHWVRHYEISHTCVISLYIFILCYKISFDHFIISGNKMNINTCSTYNYVHAGLGFFRKKPISSRTVGFFRLFPVFSALNWKKPVSVLCGRMFKTLNIKYSIWILYLCKCSVIGIENWC